MRVVAPQHIEGEHFSLHAVPLENQGCPHLQSALQAQHKQNPLPRGLGGWALSSSCPPPLIPPAAALLPTAAPADLQTLGLVAILLAAQESTHLS